MTNKYELTTIKDIFDKVPADRIETCMAELAELLRQSAVLRDGVIAAAKADGNDLDVSKVLRMPESITWNDDNLGELSLTVSSLDGEELLSVQTRL